MSFLYDRLMRIHLITAESPASRRLRFGRLIQFPQLTMPLIAALTPPEHEVSHTDEIVERVRFDAPADLVGITAPTPSALHAYDIARQFRRRGVPVVIGGPHATALPEEAARHADAVVVGEAEDTWPHVLDDARRGKLEQVYVSSRQAPLVHMPAPRWRPERSGSRAASTRRRRSSAGSGVRVRGSGGISLATWATCSRVSRRGTPLQVRATNCSATSPLRGGECPRPKILPKKQQSTVC